jgi:Cu-Zn family superoxide dismutase
MSHSRWRLLAVAALASTAVLAALRLPLWGQPPGSGFGGGGAGRRGGGARGDDSGSGGQERSGPSALAVLVAAPGGPQVDGTVLFYSRGGAVQVVADISGFDRPGRYALHVHEKGECVADPAGKEHFASAGGDLNPAGAPHGCPPSARSHAGDLGNVEIGPDGTGHLELATKGLALTGASSVVDKAVTLHAAADDCTTQPDGNAGARLACGIAKAVESSRSPRRSGRAQPGGSPPPG